MHSDATDNYLCSDRCGRDLHFAPSRKVMTAFQLALLALLVVAALAMWLLPKLVDALFNRGRE